MEIALKYLKKQF